MLSSFLKKSKQISGLLNLNGFTYDLTHQQRFNFATNQEENLTIEDKIKSVLKNLGAIKDSDTNINYTQSDTKPLAGIKYSLESGPIPNLLLLEFYTSGKFNSFVQILEGQKSINPRLMRNINYVSSDNSIVISENLTSDEEKELFNDIKNSATEFYKDLIKDNQLGK